MKTTLLIIAYTLVVTTNANKVKHIDGHNPGPQDEKQGGKLHTAVMKQRMPKNNIKRHSLNA
jgi:hypothetical protein